ncbi:MAG: c-type cytochrome [Labilithrix sp.]
MNALRHPIAATRRALVTSLLVLPCLVAAVVAGCGDDEGPAPVTTTLDSGVDSSSVGKDANTADNFVPPSDSGSDASDSGPQDAGDDGAALAALQARGKYLVEGVIGCSDCHTPRDKDGPIAAKFLSGVDCFIDVDGPTDGGCLSSSNLTNDPTGLKNRTDEEIKTMFMEGKRPNGQFLNNVMPYYTLHNLRAEDADAIVAYLRTVPAVSHTARPNDPPFANVPAASPSFDQAKLPTVTDAGTGADLANGRYLAQLACLECHTRHLPPGSPTVLDENKLFAGNESFPAAALGLPTGPGGFPDTIYSANITPHANGLAGWSVDDVKKAMQKGLDRQDGGVCPPMPAGPLGVLGKMTDKDALDVASFIHGIPAVDNTIDGGSGSCVVPKGP